MSHTGRSFETIRELAVYLNENDVANSSIVSIEHNLSGTIDLVHAGAYDHEAGTGGTTVSVPAGATVTKVSGYANGGDGTITIGAMDDITVRNGAGFDEPVVGLRAPDDATLDIVFSATMDYFVSWIV